MNKLLIDSILLEINEAKAHCEYFLRNVNINEHNEHIEYAVDNLKELEKKIKILLNILGEHDKNDE